MAERTLGELADFANRLAKQCIHSSSDMGWRGYADGLNEIARVLRAMEGERIEVYVDPEAFRVAQNHKAEARSFEIPTWTFPQIDIHRNAILIIQHGEDKSE